MKAVKVWFCGRRAGAIGCCQNHFLTFVIKDATETNIRNKVYETHEHISNFHFEIAEVV